MNALKCRVCKCTLFLQTNPGKPAKYLCPFCGARFAESKPASRSISYPPSLNETLRANGLKDREWVTWTGAGTERLMTWLVSWNPTIDAPVIHAEITAFEDTKKRKYWTYWVWDSTNRGMRIMKDGRASKGMAEAKRCCIKLLRELGDTELVELPSAR